MFVNVNVAVNVSNFFFRKIHMFRGRIQIQASIRILPLSHVCANLFDCYNVMDLLLDQTRSRSSEGDVGRY